MLSSSFYLFFKLALLLSYLLKIGAKVANCLRAHNSLAAYFLCSPHFVDLFLCSRRGRREFLTKVTMMNDHTDRKYSQRGNVFQPCGCPKFFGNDIAVDLFVRSPPAVLSREVSGRCHCFSRPLPLLAAAAANIVPVRCQRKRRGLFPAPVWPGPNLSPPFSSHPCCCGKARGLSSCLPFLCAHKQVNCYIITSFF